jgi:predicted DNA-binding transcriptional regulator YafY
MAETTSRLLSLLTLLQTHRQWTGPQLADRLGVTERTLRRDVERVRELGYRVDAVRGPAGGYRLEAGSEMPPLLLTDDETVVMAIGLQLAAGRALVDGELTAQTALAKFEQVLPSRLRPRVTALASHVASVASSSVPVSGDLVGLLAMACRDSERIRFRYVAANGVETARLVEPQALVAAARAWVLVCWDVERADWRTFRVDRMSDFFATRVRFSPRELPTGDAAAFVASAMQSMRRRYAAEVILRMPVSEVRAALGVWGAGATAIDDHTTLWPLEGESPEHLLGALAWIPPDATYEVRGDDEFLSLVARVGRAMTAATPTP